MIVAPERMAKSTSSPEKDATAIDGSPADDLADHADPLLDREERRLLVLLEDRDDHPIREPPRPREDVEMAVRQGIEGTGIDGDSFRHAPLPPSVVIARSPSASRL